MAKKRLEKKIRVKYLLSSPSPFIVAKRLKQDKRNDEMLYDYMARKDKLLLDKKGEYVYKIVEILYNTTQTIVEDLEGNRFQKHNGNIMSDVIVTPDVIIAWRKKK